MIRSNKLSNFTERILCDRRPITADVFLTDFCNNRCSYCRYKDKRTGKYITLSEFQSIAMRLHELGVRGIILTGGGEPTINPQFEGICAWLEEQRIDYGVNTNMNELKFVRPNFVKVSVDSGDRDRYAEIRGVDTLNKVLHNLKTYVLWKCSNSPQTKVGVQCVAQSAEQVRSFYEVVKDIAVDYIQFRPLETRNKQIEYSSILHAIDELQDKRIVRSYKFELTDYRPDHCIGNWSVITVDVNGNVPYCCHRPDEVIASVFDDDILRRLQNYTPDMSKCETPCRLSGANHFMETFSKENDIYFV